MTDGLERNGFSCAICGRTFGTSSARNGHYVVHGGRKGSPGTDFRCPGGGTQLVTRTYTVRKIEPEDRARWARFAQDARDRGDLEEAEGYERSLAEWEKEQGQQREQLVCPVCGNSHVPTSRGTSRPHRRTGANQPTWEKARQLREDIQVLQAELDRVLEALEP
jgi:predicted RNA-binding Zn-ribbon protein involved in translation (DUF1610 family)